MNILMYYDGTEYTKGTLPLVIKHARAFNARVDVVSSLPKGGEHQLKDIESIESELDYVKGTLDRAKISCETHLLIKGHNAGEDITNFAFEHKVDEIILGTEKKSRVEKFFLGSVAEYVIINTTCPVVVV